jgi:predicted phage tail protein
MVVREVWLHGRLRKKYGSPFRLAVKSAAEAIRALSAQLKGFRFDVAKMDFWVVYGELRRGVSIPLEAVDINLGSKPLHFYPVPQGAKSGSGGALLKTVIGAALITASFFAPEAAAAAGFSIAVGTAAASITLGLGVSLFLGGISSLISPHPQSSTTQQTTPGYVFQGPANVTAQGVSIPVVYGTCMCGTVVIAASLSNSDILDGQVGTPSKTGQIFGASS